jgi:hypothetical protein
MRRHLLLVHNKTPDYICKLCSQHFESSKQLKSHAYQAHNVNDDLMETLSVSSDDQNRDVDFDGDDTSDSLSYNSDTTFHNGRENVDPTDLTVSVNGLDIMPKLEGNVTVVTTPPEQVTVT